jgi:Flp pilus assembly protein TadG
MRCFNRKYSESGQVLILSILVLTVLLIMAAIALDIGTLTLAAEQSQHVAEAATLAGVESLRVNGIDSNGQTMAVNAALAVANANKVLNQQVQCLNSDVQVGQLIPGTGGTYTIGPWTDSANAIGVSVTIRRETGASNGNNPIPTVFARVFGSNNNNMQIKRTAIASVQIYHPQRKPISLIVAQDGSSSFQNEWTTTTTAITQLFQLINNASISGDEAGFIVFNAVLPTSWLSGQGTTFYNDYTKTYPQMNQGTKYSTDTSGLPRLCDANGVGDSQGQERPLTMTLTNFQTGQGYSLTSTMSTGVQLIMNDTGWGDTEHAIGINWAISQLQAGPAGNQKVIIVISDGEPHSVGGQSETNQFITDANNAAATAAADGITIHTVCVAGTSGEDLSFMAGLCCNGGYAFQTANANELAAVLIQIGQITYGAAQIIE